MWICRLLFVCLCVCLFVNLSLCTVTDFSAGYKASVVKFCMMVHGRPGHGISHFGELCSSRSPKSDESAPVLKMFFSKKGTVSKGRVSGHPGHPTRSAPEFPFPPHSVPERTYPETFRFWRPDTDHGIKRYIFNHQGRHELYTYSKWELLGLIRLQLQTVTAQKITLITAYS